MLNPEPSPCESQEFFHDHPGYSAIMEHLPKVFVAIVSGPYFSKTNEHHIHPVELAVRNLLALYDELLSWARIKADGLARDPELYADYAGVNPEGDFPLAAWLLVEHLRTADPRGVRGNAQYIAGLVEMFNGRCQRFAHASINHVRECGYL